MVCMMRETRKRGKEGEGMEEMMATRKEEGEREGDKEDKYWMHQGEGRQGDEKGGEEKGGKGGKRKKK